MHPDLPPREWGETLIIFLVIVLDMTLAWAWRYWSWRHE